MNFSSLARKQKRLKDWSAFLSSSVQDDAIRLALAEQLKAYRNLLAKCWEDEQVVEEDLGLMHTQERKIEELVEEARFAAR